MSGDLTFWGILLQITLSPHPSSKDHPGLRNHLHSITTPSQAGTLGVQVLISVLCGALQIYTHIYRVDGLPQGAPGLVPLGQFWGLFTGLGSRKAVWVTSASWFDILSLEWKIRLPEWTYSQWTPDKSGYLGTSSPLSTLDLSLLCEAVSQPLLN